ncbi:MAG: hypothetical protein NT154_05710 [Verrucomicrobia bacterium]|nr:hypothetical protein [Verrucomicrobiota bacterium]
MSQNENRAAFRSSEWLAQHGLANSRVTTGLAIVHLCVGPIHTFVPHDPFTGCRVKGSLIVFGDDAHYSLPLAALDSPLAILQHVVHLCDKSWIPRETIQQFIELACAHYVFPQRGDIGGIP